MLAATPSPEHVCHDGSARLRITFGDYIGPAHSFSFTEQDDMAMREDSVDVAVLVAL